MSLINSTAAVVESANFKALKALPGTITLPASQVAPGIENAGQNADRMAAANAKWADFRAEPAQRANFKGESPDGYNHPTGILSQANPPPALEENALKSILAERTKNANAKRAAIRAASLDHPDTVEIAGRVYGLRKMPKQRRVYFGRLAQITIAPAAAVRLKCYECSGYSVQEARACNCRECALGVLQHHRAARKLENLISEEA